MNKEIVLALLYIIVGFCSGLTIGINIGIMRGRKK